MSSGRKRTTDRHYSAEDQALDQISKEAEEKIQARRQARAEAREIRLREIERQQKEEEEKQKGLSKAPDLSSLSGYSGSRRGSDDSTGSDISSSSRDPKDQVRVVKNKLRDLEEKYKAAMVTNAQLDNIKTSHVFQLELLKEQIEEQEEAMIEVQREYKEKSRVYDLLKRDFDALKLETEVLRQQIDMKDKLIKESGLVIATTDDGNLSLSRCSDLFDVPVAEMGSAIISEESADLLKKAGEGTLGKTDLSSKNDTSNVKHDLDSFEAEPKTNVDNVVQTNADSLDTSAEDNVNTYSNVDKFSDTIAEVHIDNNDNVDTADSGDGNHNIVIDENIDSVANNVADNVKPNVVVDSVDNSLIENEGKGDVESVRVVSERESKGDDSSDRNKKGDDSDVESDENDVFYESKAELSPTEVKDDSSKNGESEVCEEFPEVENNESDKATDDKSQDFPVTKTSENDDDENHKNADLDGSIIDVNENISKECISESNTEVGKCVVDVSKVETEVIDDKAEDGETKELIILGVSECNNGKNDNESKCPDLVFNLDETDSEVVESNVDTTVILGDSSNSFLCTRPVLPSESFISLESDVTYHSESDDDMNTGLESVSEDIGTEVGKNDETRGVVDDQTDSVFDDCILNQSKSAIPLCSSLSSESDLDENTRISNEQISEEVWNEINKASVDKNFAGNDVCRSFPDDRIGLHSDDVFMSTPLDDVRAEISMDTFAREYVKDVIQKSVDLYNNYVEQDKISVRKQSVSGEKIDITVSKSHYSEELLDTASSVFTERLPSGSVEILSPFQGVSTNTDDQQVFFSCKVETDIGGVKNDSPSEERKPSLISGFAVCYTGLEGLSDVESDSDESEGTAPVVNMESSDFCPDFCIMPMNLTNKRSSDDSSPLAVETDESIKHESEEQMSVDDSVVCTNSEAAIEKIIDDSTGSCRKETDETNDEDVDAEATKGGNDSIVKHESTDPPFSDVSDIVSVSNPVEDNHTNEDKVESTDDKVSENNNLESVVPEKNDSLDENALQCVVEKSVPIIDADRKEDCSTDDNNPVDDTSILVGDGNTDMMSIESAQGNVSKKIESENIETTEENASDINEVHDENGNSTKEPDEKNVEVRLNENQDDVVQGAHGGESDDDDDDHSGISLSDDDILADLEKCEESDGSHVTDIKDVSENKAEVIKEDNQEMKAQGDEDIWVKKDDSAIDDKDRGKQVEDSPTVTRGKLGNKKSGEVSPTETSGKPGNRKSDEVSVGDEDDLESELSRKQSKKKSKKKNSKEKEECRINDKLKKILADKKQLQEEITILTNQISEERAKRHEGGSNKNSMNGPAAELQLYEIQREASKQIHEYKLKLQKAEQEITNLDGTVNRLETQVKRFKYDAEEAERLEEELKSDRRRLQRELRECQNQIEELQNQNKHLTKRLEKIRQTRSALGVNT